MHLLRLIAPMFSYFQRELLCVPQTPINLK